jgi:hypothetical protein
LLLEPLEGRCLPSTVTNLNDAGAGSLRQAIIDTPAGGTVDFQPGLSGIITLTTGELAIGKDLTIAGPGADVITVSGNHASRVFDIGATVTVDISRLTIADGSVTNANGGGIYSKGALTVTACTLSGNKAQTGGAIANETGSLTVTASTLSGNSGGGIYNFSNGPVTVTASTLSGNSGGGIYNFSNGPVTVTASTLSGNSDGGIFNQGTLTVTASTLSGNSAFFGGGIYNYGTVTVTDSTLSGNSAGSYGSYGGGIYNGYGGTLTVTDCTLSGNSAIYGGGGGIYNQGTLTVTHSTLSSNSAGSYGGGILGGSSGQPPMLTVTDCTLSGNSAANSGGGIYNVSTLIVTNSTLSGNSAQFGGGIDNGPLTVTTKNMILAGNMAPFYPDVVGHLNSEGHNLIGDGTGGSGYDPTDLVGTSDNPIDPKLGALQANGGPTQTRALLLGSPAIAAGDVFDAPPTDQRGAPRIVNGTIDMGAYEVQAAPAPSSSVVHPLLWPPDGQFVNVGLSVGLNDDADPSVHLSLQVYANDNADASDAADIAPGTLQLRAERQDNGDGRVYLIVATATDASGQTGFDVSTVVVPHDQSGGSIAKVQAEAAAAEAYYREFQAAPAGYALLGEGPAGADGNDAPIGMASVVGLRPAGSTSEGAPAVLGGTVTVIDPPTAPVSLEVQPDHATLAETVPAPLPAWDAHQTQDAVFQVWDEMIDGLAGTGEIVVYRPSFRGPR